jgi:phosphoribosylformimino-5-aminoimidazole carboxamide ribotide isomerase
MEMEDLGARWIIHTDVATDGAMKGPNFAAQLNMLKAAPRCKIIASGGVSKEQDVLELQKLANEHNNLEGVIIGKALYENTVNLEKLV